MDFIRDNKEVFGFVFTWIGIGVFYLILWIIERIIDRYTSLPEPTLKQSLKRIKWLLGGILVVLIMLLRK